MNWIQVFRIDSAYGSTKLNSFFFEQILFHPTDKKMAGKSKDEQLAEKKQELEMRLQDVSGKLGSAKKTAKKGRIPKT